MPKTDKNSMLHCTLINLRYFCTLHPFLNVHEKVIPLIVDLRKYAKQSEARKFYDMSGEK